MSGAAAAYAYDATRDTLVVAVSQSGTTTDTNRAKPAALFGFPILNCRTFLVEC